MRWGKSRIVWRAVGLLSGCGLLVSGFALPVQAAALGLDPDGYYEVLYQLSDTEARSIRPVKVLELIKIGAREFVVVEPTNFPQKMKGYIAFERISAILPTQVTGFPRVDSAPTARSITP